MILNVFYKATQKWGERFGNYDKFVNFSGCMLPLTGPYDVSLHLNKQNLEVVNCLRSKTIEEHGSCLDILEMILKQPDVSLQICHKLSI